MKRERILAAVYRYGEEIKIFRRGKSGISVRAFVQPLRYKNRMYVGGSQIPEGYRDGGHFLLICPKKADLTEKGVLIERRGGDKYIIKRADDVVFENETLYVWAIITPYYAKKEDAYDAVSQRIY